MSILGPGHCDTCQWWGGERAGDDNYPYGRCRAQPPKRGVVMTLPYHGPDRPEAKGPLIRAAEWPWTAFDDWCANHLDKKRTIGL